MTIVRAATLVLSLLAAGPAVASGSIGCVGADGAVRIDLTVGALPVLKIVAATIEARGTALSTGGEDDPILVGQAFGDGERILADFTDDNAERIVASLRLVKAEGEGEVAMAGTLSLRGHGVHAVSCTGP